MTSKEKLELIGIDAICQKVADCITLQKIADESGVSKWCLIQWLALYPNQYTRAREAQADKLADDLLQIADDGLNDTYIDEDGNKRTDQDVIARSRLRVEARKWLAGKMAPKKYGERLDTTITATVTTKKAEDLSDDELASIIASRANS